MDEGDLRAFANRDWAAVAEARAAYWRRRKRERGAGEGIRSAEALREEVQAQRPDWPEPEARRNDLLSHARLSAELRRVRP